MLTALSALPAPLKFDPAPASAPRPGATVEGDNSFASLIRRQAGQRLDAPSPADPPALAAPVSAAAATSMPRPVVEALASRPPMPGQAADEPSPLPPSAAAAAAAAASATGTIAGTATATATATDTAGAITASASAGSDSTQPSPAPTRPDHATAAAARAKAPSSAGRVDTPRSLAARIAQADSLAANRSPRERKPGTAPAAEVSAELATTGAAGLPPPLADTGPTGLVGKGAGAAAQDPGAAPQPAPGLPLDLTALPAAQAPAATGAPAGTGVDKAVNTGQIGPGLTPARLPATTSAAGGAVANAAGSAVASAASSAVASTAGSAVASAVASAQVKRPAASLPPAQPLGDVPGPAIAVPGSPAPTHARNAKVSALSAGPPGQGADAAVAAASAPARPFGQAPEPASEGPSEQRQRSPGGPSALPAAQHSELAAAALSGAWRPGPAPAAGEIPAAPAESHPPSRRASPGLDRSGPEPRHAAGPATLDRLAAAALPPAQTQPDVAAPRGFDNALQAALTQGPAQPGTVAGPQPSGEPPRAMQIDAAVDSPLFAPALGSQLSLLARDGVRSALLQLHPAEMGPISVEIALDGNAARIDFQALRADTRSLIEASLPALAGALQDAGLTLAGGGVFEQAPGRQQAQAQAEPGPGARPPGLANGGPAGPHDSAPLARRIAPRGLVDLVA